MVINPKDLAKRMGAKLIGKVEFNNGRYVLEPLPKKYWILNDKINHVCSIYSSREKTERALEVAKMLLKDGEKGEWIIEDCEVDENCDYHDSVLKENSE